MEVYGADGSFVLAVCGGEFHAFQSEPKAIITKNRPTPSKWWTIPRAKDKTLSKGPEEWEVDTEFREFLCDEENVYILQFHYQRVMPAYAAGKAEFFVTEEYVKEKIKLLKKSINITEYHWDDSIPTWKEIQPKKYYRKV